MKAKKNKYQVLDTQYTYEDIKALGLTVHESSKNEEHYEVKVQTAKKLLVSLRKNPKYRTINIERASERVAAIPSLTPHLRKFVYAAIGKKYKSKKKKVELMVKRSAKLFSDEQVNAAPSHSKSVYCKPARPCVECRNSLTKTPTSRIQ